jgi:hypothetical protein
MEIFQNDIFGVKHQTSDLDQNRKPPQPTGNAKPFRQIGLTDGIDEEVASNDAMLIHRILQKKLLYSGLSSKKQRDVLLRILYNEMNIKAGNIEPATASRDSLLASFCGIV